MSDSVFGSCVSMYHAASFPPTEADLIKETKVLKTVKGLSLDEKQRDYINAIDIFYTDWEHLDHKIRVKQLELKVEATFFYTLALYSTRDKVGKEGPEN